MACSMEAYIDIIGLPTNQLEYKAHIKQNYFDKEVFPFSLFPLPF